MKKVKIFSMSLFGLFLMIFIFVFYPSKVFAAGGGGGGGGTNPPENPTSGYVYDPFVNGNDFSPYVNLSPIIMDLSVTETRIHEEGAEYVNCYFGTYGGGFIDIPLDWYQFHKQRNFAPEIYSVLKNNGDWSVDGFISQFGVEVLWWNPIEKYWQLESIFDFEPVFEGETAFVTNVDNPMSVEDILSHIRLIDDHDGDVSHTITIISDNYTPNKNTLGTYEIEIEGHDLSNNYAQLTIYVLVKDITEPIISGQSNYQQSYTKKLNVDIIKNGLTVSDNYDSNLEIILESDNYSSNYNRLGSYNVVFSATDSSGNKGTFTVNINVIDDVAPVFSGPTSILKGVSEILSVDDIKAQLTANDFISGQVAIIVKSDNYTGNGNKVGTYTIVFEAQDEAGNIATHTVTVTVADNIPPIFYVDNYFITVEQSLMLTREDIIAILQASGQLNVQSSTNVQFLLNEYEGNESVVGIYAVTLKASSADGSGKIFNLAVQVVEDEGGTVVHPEDPWYKQVGGWFIEAWNWLKKPVKENSWLRWGYVVGFGAIVLVLGLVRVGSASGRRYRRRW